MKILIVVLAVAISLGLAVSDVLAFSCPSLQKAANESIAKAEQAAGKVADDREKGRAQGMVEVAKGLVKSSEESHKKGAHYQAEAQAKAGKALADMVK